MRIRSTSFLAVSLAVIPAFLSVAAAQSPASKTAEPLVPSLGTARTIQVSETVYKTNGSGSSRAIRSLSVKIARPGYIWIQEVVAPDEAAPNKWSKPAIFVLDGKSQTEYDGVHNEYCISAAPPAGQSPDLHIVRAYVYANTDFLLDPANAGTMAGVLVTTKSTTLDGKSTKLRTTVYPTMKEADGIAVVESEKLWVSEQTKLPVRVATYLKLGDAPTTENTYTDFTGWVLNQAIPRSQFAWAPPAGATKFMPPVLLGAGTQAPDFAATAPDGSTVHLSDFKGKPVVIDFWATWCGPCQMSMPHLEQVYQQVKDQDVAVLAVCVWDDKSAYDKWVLAKKGTFNFPTAFDPAGMNQQNSIATSLFGVTGIPTQYVIDKDGKVVSTTVGYGQGDHELEDALAKLGLNVKVAKS